MNLFDKLASEESNVDRAARYRLAQANAAYLHGDHDAARHGFSEALRSNDPKVRAAVLAQAESLVLDAASIIPVYFNTHVYLLHPAVQGWQPTPMDHTDYRYVKLQADAR